MGRMKSMQPYQEEYIANLREIAVLTAHRKPEENTFDEYEEHLKENRKKADALVKRNMELLRDELFPLLDHLFAADQAQLAGLYKFAGELLNAKEELDTGLFCQIHRALLSLARSKQDRSSMIRELYWLGIGMNSLCRMLAGLELSESGRFLSQMRLCFTEAAAYLKYFDEIEDSETRGYILRARANTALGQYARAGTKISLVKQTLEILQDQEYQQKEPALPWERFIYMTHQQMAASMSYSREDAMTAQEIEAVMESVYIVCERQIQEAARNHQFPPPRPVFYYFAVEYFCGMDSLDSLLTKMESLMDKADRQSTSGDSMYSMISLPAFYFQFLQQYPERIPEREEYIGELCQQIITYIISFPEKERNKSFFFSLRQLLYAFLETADGMTYREFLKKMMEVFAPEIYVNALVVGKAAAFFSAAIIAEEPDFFDDIAQIREITDPDKKRREILEFAEGCGLLHDVGKLSFMNLYSGTSRQWFEEEYEMAHLHTYVGGRLLKQRSSTSRYAAAALGHHFWYDGSRGYPEYYRRLEYPERQMTDIIGLVDWLENVTNTARLFVGVEKTFDEAVQEAIALEGKRFSPILTSWLKDVKFAGRLKQIFAEERQNAYRRFYENNHNQVKI